jgi:molybdopterin converting factor small subunit
VAELHLPTTLQPLSRERRGKQDVEGARVGEAIDRHDAQWPGLRDRLCEQGHALRPHIHVYVDRERAGLDTGLDERSRVDVIAAISGG